MGKYVKTLSKGCLWGVDLLIFVTLGTQDKPFTRLLKAIDGAIQEGIIKEPVIVQAGHTKYESSHMTILGMLSMEEYHHYMEKCDLLITHGGVGSIFDALKLGKKIIASPRLKKYGEHVNDHQIQLIDAFEEKNFLIAYREHDDFANIYVQAVHMNPVKYVQNNQKMISIVQNFIENN